MYYDHRYVRAVLGPSNYDIDINEAKKRLMDYCKWEFSKNRNGHSNSPYYERWIKGGLEEIYMISCCYFEESNEIEVSNAFCRT